MGTQKDWVGTRHSVFVTLGASNHTEAERAENDYYATEPLAADLLLEVEQFDGSIWENACGEGHLSERFKEAGYDVISTDLIDRGYGKGNVDFYACQTALGDNIVTNPPYKKVVKWVWHCLELLEEGKKCALFLPIQFLESKERIALFKEHPPKVVYVCANRVKCYTKRAVAKHLKN